MPSITIKEQEYSYSGDELINFTEGLVGLPEMRRAALIPLPEFEPFFWLASIDDEKTRFIVVDPYEIFSDYDPAAFVRLDAEQIKTLVIVKISSDWEKTTLNLRAPIFINDETKRGVQMVLTESPYNLSEALPQN